METQCRSMYHLCLFRYDRGSVREYLAGHGNDLTQKTDEGDGGDEGDLARRQRLRDEREVVPDVDQDQHEHGVSRGNSELVERVEQIGLVFAEDELEVDAVALVDVDVDSPEPQLETIEHLETQKTPERLHLDACERDGELDGDHNETARVGCS